MAIQYVLLAGNEIVDYPMSFGKKTTISKAPFKGLLLKAPVLFKGHVAFAIDRAIVEEFTSIEAVNVFIDLHSANETVDVMHQLKISEFIVYDATGKCIKYSIAKAIGICQ